MVWGGGVVRVNIFNDVFVCERERIFLCVLNSVCVCVYITMCVYASMGVFIHVWILCVYTRVCLSMCVSMPLCVHVCAYLCVYMCVYVCVCVGAAALRTCSADCLIHSRVEIRNLQLTSRK